MILCTAEDYPIRRHCKQALDHTKYFFLQEEKMVWVDQIHFVANSLPHYLFPVFVGELSYRIIISWPEHNKQMLEKSLPLLERFKVPSYQIHIQKLLICREQCVNHIISLLYVLYQILPFLCYSPSLSLLLGQRGRITHIIMHHINCCFCRPSPHFSSFLPPICETFLFSALNMW